MVVPKTVTHNEDIRDGETDVIGLEIGLPFFQFVQQNTGLSVSNSFLERFFRVASAVCPIPKMSSNWLHVSINNF